MASRRIGKITDFDVRRTAKPRLPGRLDEPVAHVLLLNEDLTAMNHAAMLFFFLSASAAIAQEPLTPRERMLLDRIEKLEQRLAALEARAAGSEAPAQEAQAPFSAVQTEAAPSSLPAEAVPAGTTISVNLDGYYGYNFNRPFTGMNALRGYDVSGNSFAINQAGLVVERAPDVAAGRRLGARIDLMVGQATETLQGSPENELRPEVFRHLFQAYGTYIVPAGQGVTVDFGKWASSFGIEGNYTKDQFNYSRAYWFSFLPFYHMGIRASYPVTRHINATYWLTNGLNQTEDFNGFKSQAVLLNFQPSPRVSANLNYFAGQEQRRINGQAPRGRSHFIDSYVTWQASERWDFAAEAAYAIERLTPASPLRLVYGGAGYARYRLSPRFNLAGRFTYLNDRDALFSGKAQALKDATATATFDLADGFQMRWELRRDWSNRSFFLTNNPNVIRRGQATALVGLIWWFGGKQGPW